MTELHADGERFLTRLAVGATIIGIAARVFAIGRLPGINGDEAWYLANLQALAAGQPGFWVTPSGNPLNPLHSGVLYALSLVFPPSLALLRVPEVLLSIVAVIVAYPLLRPSIGARAALIATVLLAVSPVAITYGRLGWDPSGTPLVTLIALALALRDEPIAAVAVAVLAIVVHPTNVFFLPIVVAAWIPHARRRYSSASPSARKRMWAAAAMAGVAATIALGLMLRSAAGNPATVLPSIAVTWQRSTSPSTWAAFAQGVNEMFAGIPTVTFVAGPPGWPMRVEAASIGFIALLAAVRIQRRAGAHHFWMLIGIATSAAMFMIAAGPAALQPGSERYTLFFLAPLIVVCSMGAGALPPTWSRRYAAVVAAGMLGFVGASYFVPLMQRGGDGHATFRTGLTEPKYAAFEYVRAHSTGGATIVCEDWWLYWPIKSLAGAEPRLSVTLSPTTALPPSVAGQLVSTRAGAIAEPTYEIVFDGSGRWSMLSARPPVFTALDPIGRPILHVFKVQ